MLPWYWKIIYFFIFVPLGIFLGTLLTLEAGVHFFFCLPLRALLRGIHRRQADGRKTRILCLAYMTDDNASARHRLYKIAPFIEKNVVLKICPPTSAAAYRRFFQPWKRSGHFVYFTAVFFNRFAAMGKAPFYDAVFLQREIISEFFLDPPFFIFILWMLNPKIIYDFDDAIWMIPPHSVRAKSRLQSFLARQRFRWNVRLSRRVIVSNAYLHRKAMALNRNVSIIPTLVDVDDYPTAHHRLTSPVIIGWIGGAGNLSYLKQIEKPLANLSRCHAIVLKIVSSRAIQLKGVKVDFVAWEKATASKEVGTFDIGIMPLTENAYTKGKGGFKILEYMAAGIPAVASRVGVNSEIIVDGTTGFLADTDIEWEQALERLITDESLRQSVGTQSKRFVAAHFDYRCWKRQYVEILTASNLEKKTQRV